MKAEECYQGLWCISVRTDTGYKCSAKSALRPADGTPCAGGKVRQNKFNSRYLVVISLGKSVGPPKRAVMLGIQG